MVDVSKIKVGDVVHVRMTVVKGQQDSGGKIFCNSNSMTSPHHIKLRDVVHVEPRALQVGDRVTWGHGSFIGEVRAIGGRAGVAVAEGGSRASR